jgi:hypothetical protein
MNPMTSVERQAGTRGTRMGFFSGSAKGRRFRFLSSIEERQRTRELGAAMSAFDDGAASSI